MPILEYEFSWGKVDSPNVGEWALRAMDSFRKTRGGLELYAVDPTEKKKIKKKIKK
jgi:hypothetical protein